MYLAFACSVVSSSVQRGRIQAGRLAIIV